MIDNTKQPRIRFKGFTDHWEQRKLGETVQITMGQSPNGNTYSDIPSDYILVQGNADLQNGWVFPRVWTSQMTKQADAGDLIMSVRAPAGAMGKTAYNTVIGRGVAAIKGNEFIYQILVKMDSERFWKALSYGSTFESLNSDNIKNAYIHIPTLAEQKKIGDFFVALDRLISKQKRKVEKLTSLKKALLEKMFPTNNETTPRIRFKGFTDAWEQRKLGEVGTTFTGLSGKTRNDFGHGDASFITYMNVFSNPIADLNQNEIIEIDKRQCQVKYGDVFFTTSSETPEEVGMSSIWLGNKSNVYLNSFCFGFRPTKLFDPYYLGFMLRSTSIRKKFILLAQGISRYNISKNKAMNIKISIPALSEQQKIGDLFVALDRLITLHKKQIEKLKQIKSSLLENMFV